MNKKLKTFIASTTIIITELITNSDCVDFNTLRWEIEHSDKFRLDVRMTRHANQRITKMRQAARALESDYFKGTVRGAFDAVRMKKAVLAIYKLHKNASADNYSKTYKKAVKTIATGVERAIAYDKKKAEVA